MENYLLETVSLFLGVVGTLLIASIWRKYFNLGYDNKYSIQINQDESIRIGGIMIILLFILISYIAQIFEETPFLLCFIPLVAISLS